MLKTPKRRKPVTVGTVDPGDEPTHSVRVCYEAPADQIFAHMLQSAYLPTTTEVCFR